MSRLTLTQGIDSGYRWPMFDEFNNPVDLDGWTAKCQIRASESFESTLLAELDCRVEDSAVFVNWGADESKNWTFKSGFYDVVLIDPEGVPRQIVAEGEAVVNRIVTDA